MSWGGKRRAEKKERARALVWIDVWAWADVPAAGPSGARSQAGVRAVGGRGRSREGPAAPPPASAAWHQVPPPPSSPPWASVGPCQSGAGAGVWGPPPHVPPPGCATQSRPLGLSGLGVQGLQNGAVGGERLFWHFGHSGVTSGSILLSLGQSGGAHTLDTGPSTAPRVIVPSAHLARWVSSPI